jgi:hypothetical protein
VLNALFQLADSRRMLTPFQVWAICYRVFLYEDNLVIFLTPASQDIRAVHTVLELFAGAIGLCTNVSKCQLTLIICSKDETMELQQAFPCQVVHFPCRYSGLPLSVYKLHKFDLQLLADAVANRLPS